MNTIFEFGSSRHDRITYDHAHDQQDNQKDDQNDHYFYIKNRNTQQYVLTYYNKPILDLDAKKYLINSKVEMNDIEITKYILEAKHVCLFYEDSDWYFVYPNEIINLNDEKSQNNIVLNIFLELQKQKFSFDDLDKNYCWHFLVCHPQFRKYGWSNSSNIANIYHLWTSEKYTLKKILDKNVPNIEHIKNYNFSCIDEMLTSLDVINYFDIENKYLSCGGYYVKIKYPDRFVFLTFRTEIFKHIMENMNYSQSNNKYILFLMLYQNNKLSEILPYVHKYPHDIIKRINMAMKTISREILNIYHLTRKKKNSNLYEKLSNNYRKILYDLHNIYVHQKHSKLKRFRTNNFLVEKSSITVDIVYQYIKMTSLNDLVQIFIDRKELVELLKTQQIQNNNILFLDSLDVITQTELMMI